MGVVVLGGEQYMRDESVSRVIHIVTDKTPISKNNLTSRA